MVGRQSDQLQQLGERLDVTVHVGAEGESPAQICAAAAERARREGFDAIVYDTAGRLAIDEELMQELSSYKQALQQLQQLLLASVNII